MYASVDTPEELLCLDCFRLDPATWVFVGWSSDDMDIRRRINDLAEGYRIPTSKYFKWRST